MADEMMTGYLAGQADSNNNCNGGGMWGGDGSWIFAFLIIALIFGGNGWGWGGNNGAGGAGVQGAITRADLCESFNFNGLDNAVRGVQSGLCDGFYAMNTGMLNGFNATQMAISNGFHGVDNAVCQLGYQNAQLINGVNQNMNTGFTGVTAGLTALGNQLQSCCCESQRQVERGFCDTNYNAATNTRDIIQSTHNDTDRIIARIDQMETARQAEKIAALQLENQGLKFAASQAAQNTYLTASQAEQTNRIINAINPAPIPAYQVPNPYTGVGVSCGCNSGCGC